MEQTLQNRVDQLEAFVASLRHDIRGLITPAALVADRLMLSGDPAIQHSARTIIQVVECIVAALNATYDVVPPRPGSGA